MIGELELPCTVAIMGGGYTGGELETKLDRFENAKKRLEVEEGIQLAFAILKADPFGESFMLCLQVATYADYHKFLKWFERVGFSTMSAKEQAAYWEDTNAQT